MGVINFNENFERALAELYQRKEIEDGYDAHFKISISREEKVKMKSKDLLYFPYSTMENKLLTKEEVVRILSGPRCTFPLWIDMSLIKHNKEIIVYLKCSCRFRKSSELLNQDTEFPPFRIL